MRGPEAGAAYDDPSLQKYPKWVRYLVNHPFWRAAFKGGVWRDTPKDRYQHIMGNLWLHLHPAKVRPHALRFSYTWGLGGASFWLFLILTFTGVFLMFYYRPTVPQAFYDMKDLAFAVSFGPLARNLHRWAAHAMVVVVILHMLRVFLTGSYKDGREFNWCIGVVLLVLTLFLSFTGYLLPWDNLAIWAVTVGSNMASATPFVGAEGPFSNLLGITADNDARFMLLGGRSVGENALLRFYVLHCVFLPAIAGTFMMVHFWRVRKDEFSGPPIDTKAPPEKKYDTWPHLVIREELYAAIWTIAMILWSILMQAPLEPEADPTINPNPSKAPWYFTGLQEMLVYFDPWIAGVVAPTLIILGLMAIPFTDPNPNGIGRYRLSERPFVSTFFLLGIFMWFFLIGIGTFIRGPDWAWYWPWEDWAAHKPPPPPTWNLPAWLGGGLLLLYFGGGMALPRLVRRELPWRKYVPAGIGLALLFGIALYGLSALPAVQERLLAASNGTVKRIGIPEAAWVVFFAAAFYFLGFLMPQRYIRSISFPRYVTAMFFLLTMLGFFLKVGVRLGFNVKYILTFPQFRLSI